MSHISEEQVRHVATLSRLEFSDAEIQEFSREMNQILDYFVKLNELDTEGVPPGSHPLKTSNVLREDIPRESLSNELALSNAPDKEEGFFKVPQILPGD
ncbi:Asp-tRNA(Asn)/Glu-tRNA(Gln) amidotransferase subunit GatC [Candidatus Sumerlaeota bacterium]|nr:Asp-tRNA(Asn)/Glu-tRNA(Gln) amidotransferase subunit GatC [Candidatus Sumerlaeota bacterium]